MAAFAVTVSAVNTRCVTLENKQEQIHCNVTVETEAVACQLLTDTTGLPKERIKHAMVKGAVWLKRPGSEERRLRKAKFKLKKGDFIQLFYDAAVLKQSPPHPVRIASHDDFSVWFKPPWLLTEGSRYGDHCSLLRIVEKENPDTSYKLIHRLEREASGLVILAHNSQAAKLLSQMLQIGAMEKRYYAEVAGQPNIPKEGLHLSTPIDDREAHTEILRLHPGKTRKNSILDIRLHSGRLHQIRRHLAELGHPIVGDATYGELLRGHFDLHLCAWKIAFDSPFSGKKTSYQIPRELRPAFAAGISAK
jgi:tRNA pseudouridine32 synthase/23S rRNA pseudouridine746 synthase